MIETTALCIEVTMVHGKTLVGGKVARMPDLEGRDTRPTREIGADDQFLFGANVKDYPSTHGRDKALLIALGVDGDVPIAQARLNAGLPADGSRPAMLRRGEWVAANDNHEQAAIAA